MVYLGIDYGTKNIGIAIGDDETLIATPYRVINNDDHAFAAIGEIIKAEGVSTCVVGYPQSLGGHDSAQTRVSVDFARVLEQEYPQVAVVLFNEQMTSQEAHKHFASVKMSQHPKSKDDIAAQILLQAYLDSLS